MKTVYLDNAATTPMRPEVMLKLNESMTNFFANPSATYGIGRKSKAALESSRKQIANLIGAEASEIVFTSGGTEANNIVLNGVVRDLGIKHIITSKIEHHAVLKTIDFLKSQYEIEISYVSFTESGDIDIENLKKLLNINSNKTLVSLMHINNEIGTILDLKTVGHLCKQHRALFHTDTVQSVGHFKLELNAKHVNFATASAHKFYGPKGIGFVVIRKNSGIKAFQFGGNQERGLRAGTESIHQIQAMSTALQIAYDNLEIDQKYIQNIKTYAIEQFKKKLKIVSFNANSNESYRNYNLINVCLPIVKEKASIILFKLDMMGICCSRGSACQSGSNKPSHVLAAILSKEQLNFVSLRFSFSIYTTKKDIDLLIDGLKIILA